MRSDAELRKQRILDAACELAVQHGTSMKLEAVAEKAGVGIATLYRNFPTRNALILACIMQLTDEVIIRLNQAEEKFRDPEADLEMVFREVISSTVPVGINLVVPALIQTPEDMLSEDLLEKKQQLMEALSGVIQTSRDIGFLHETVSDHWVLNGLIQLYQPPAFDFTGESKNSAEDVEAMVSVFLEGCRVGLLESYLYRDKRE